MIGEIEKAGSCLIMAHGETLKGTVLKVMKHLTKAGYSGIYISINVPHQTIDSLLKKEGIDTQNMFYIDCITALVHKMHHKKAGNVLYADHPLELKEDGTVMNEITQYLISVPGKKFVIIDTLRTLLLYNEPRIVSDFTKLLIMKTNEVDAKLITFTRKEHDEEFIKDISYRFDKTIEV